MYNRSAQRTRSVAPPTAHPGDLTDDGLWALPDLHESADVVVHELIVPYGVPRTLTWRWPFGPVRRRPSGWAIDGLREFIGIREVVASRERAVGATQHDGRYVA